MLRKLTPFFLFLILCASLKAQDRNLLIGTWIFKDVYNKEKMDEEGLKALRTQVINKLTFTFQKNGTFFGHMMGENVSGTWTQKSNPNRALKIGLGEFWMARSRKK